MKKFIVCFLLLCVLSATCLAAVAVDATSSGKAFDTTSITVSHTVSGSNRILIVGSLGTTVTGITYKKGGIDTGLTVIATVARGDGLRMELWRLIAPDTGTNNIVVSYGSTGSEWKVVTAISFTGVNQTTPLGTAVTLADTMDTSINVGSASGDLVVDGVGVGSAPTLTVGTGQTQQVSLSETSNEVVAMSTELATTTTTTMNWTGTGANYIGHVGVALKPSAASASALPVLLSSRRRR